MIKDKKNFALANVDALITIYSIIEENSDGFYGVFARNQFREVYDEYQRKSNENCQNDIVTIKNIEFFL